MGIDGGARNLANDVGESDVCRVRIQALEVQMTT